MTTQGRESVTINAGPEVVWPWIANLDKHIAWSPKPYRVELLSGEPGTVGARYRSFGAIPGDKNHANDILITEVDHAKRFALVATDDNGDHQNTYTLTPSGEGTEVTFHMVFPAMKGMAKVLLPVLFPILGKADLRTRMGLLKAKVESPS